MIEWKSFGGRSGLLVSVRSADEARVALAGGADVIDVKEPSRGPLGCADADIIRSVASEIASRVPISVAAGELVELMPDVSAVSQEVVAVGVSYIKFGLAHCGAATDWPWLWRRVVGELRGQARPVAVVYADWQAASAPEPNEVLKEAAAAGCPALLVDTWNKSAGTLFDHWTAEYVTSFCTEVHARGMAIALAGSLRGHSLVTAVRCRPELVAVRGAVCNADRQGRILLDQVRAVRATVDAAASIHVLAGARHHSPSLPDGVARRQAQ